MRTERTNTKKATDKAVDTNSRSVILTADVTVVVIGVVALSRVRIARSDDVIIPARRDHHLKCCWRMNQRSARVVDVVDHDVRRCERRLLADVGVAVDS